MKNLIALVIGLIFGSGLLISKMADPGRVSAFLDVAGAWSPALIFVMGGGLLVAAPLFAIARRRGRSLLGVPIPVPPKRGVDRQLLGGATLFGIGWGLSGICPGPALVLVGRGDLGGIVFFAGLLVGIALFHRGPKRNAEANSSPSAQVPR